jgi:hypothetical protein
LHAERLRFLGAEIAGVINGQMNLSLFKIAGDLYAGPIGSEDSPVMERTGQLTHPAGITDLRIDD